MEFRHGYDGCDTYGSALAWALFPAPDDICAQRDAYQLISWRGANFESIALARVANKRSFICPELIRPMTAVIRGCVHRFVQITQRTR